MQQVAQPGQRLTLGSWDNVGNVAGLVNESAEGHAPGTLVDAGREVVDLVESTIAARSRAKDDLWHMIW